jgi:hypothetical protein
MRKFLFNYSFYSHPEIGKFQGVTTDNSHQDTAGIVTLYYVPSVGLISCRCGIPIRFLGLIVHLFLTMGNNVLWDYKILLPLSP